MLIRIKKNIRFIWNSTYESEWLSWKQNLKIIEVLSLSLQGCQKTWKPRTWQFRLLFVTEI